MINNEENAPVTDRQDEYDELLPDWRLGQRITTYDELRQLVSNARAQVSRLTAGLSRGAWGALNGQAWIDADPRPTHDEILQALDMTATPTRLAARDAVLRQALAGLISALDAVDRAALTAWLAHVNAADPNRRA